MTWKFMADHFITMHRDFQSMPRASRHQHRVHYKDITKDHLPGRAANQYLWARDDFVNTDRDTVHQWFESILYDSSRGFQVSPSVDHTMALWEDSRRKPTPY